MIPGQPLQIGRGLGVIQLDQQVPGRDTIAFPDMDSFHDTGRDGLYKLDPAGRYDLPPRDADDVDLAYA